MTPTRTRLLALVDLWGPPIALMALIFVLSAQPDLSTDLGVWDYIGRKIVHMAEYGLLWFLWWRALREVVPAHRAIAVAFCVSVAYAVTDEIHQTFVHGRHGTPIDVGIDTLGMAIACVILLRRRT